MTSADHDRAELLNAYLDAMSSGAAQPPHEIDAAAEVRRFFALDDAPASPNGLSARMWDELMRPAMPAPAGPTPPIVVAPPSLNGAHRPQPVQPRPLGLDPARHRRPIRWNALLAVAALVLLTVGIGYALAGYGWFRDAHPKTVPAAVVNPTPTATLPAGVVSAQTLVDITIPATALPQGVGGAAFAHMTIPPETNTRWSVRQNVNLIYLLSGTLTARPDDPAQVARAGENRWRTSPAGAEVTLAAGDALVLLDPGTGEFDNLGSAPVEMIQWILASGTGSDPPAPQEWIGHEYQLSGAGAIAMPGEPARLRLQLMELDAQAVVPAQPDPIAVMEVGLTENPAGTPQSAYFYRSSMDGADHNGPAAVTAYILTLESTGFANSPPVIGSPTP